SFQNLHEFNAGFNKKLLLKHEAVPTLQPETTVVGPQPTQFLATFRMAKWDYDWSDRMEMMITANSDNNGNISDAEVRRSVPVQFAVDLAISLVAEESVTYLKFSLEDRGPKPLNIVYTVENLGLKGLPVSLKLTLPCQTTRVILTPQKFSMQENSVPCGFIKPQDGHCG
ncbi:unnamed protein product, partial [Leuciscus chuanchicus]